MPPGHHPERSQRPSQSLAVAQWQDGETIRAHDAGRSSDRPALHRALARDRGDQDDGYVMGRAALAFGLSLTLVGHASRAGASPAWTDTGRSSWARRCSASPRWASASPGCAGMTACTPNGPASSWAGSARSSSSVGACCSWPSDGVAAAAPPPTRAASALELVVLEQPATDDHFLDLGGAFTDQQHGRLAIEPFDLIFLE